MIWINMTEAKTHLSRYLKRVERSETVVLCRRNEPIAEIRPLPKRTRGPRPVGIDRGLTIPTAFFEPLPDELLAAFEGGGEAG